MTLQRNAKRLKVQHVIRHRKGIQKNGMSVFCTNIVHSSLGWRAGFAASGWKRTMDVRLGAFVKPLQSAAPISLEGGGGGGPLRMRRVDAGSGGVESIVQDAAVEGELTHEAGLGELCADHLVGLLVR